MADEADGIRRIEFKMPEQRGILVVRTRAGTTDAEMLELVPLFQAAIHAKQPGILVTDKVEGIDVIPFKNQEEQGNV